MHNQDNRIRKWSLLFHWHDCVIHYSRGLQTQLFIIYLKPLFIIHYSASTPDDQHNKQTCIFASQSGSIRYSFKEFVKLIPLQAQLFPSLKTAVFSRQRSLSHYLLCYSFRPTKLGNLIMIERVSLTRFDLYMNCVWCLKRFVGNSDH